MLPPPNLHARKNIKVHGLVTVKAAIGNLQRKKIETNKTQSPRRLTQALGFKKLGW